MKYYPVIDADGLLQYVDTQLQAKAGGVKKPEPVDFPTDKDGLRDLINDYEAKLHTTPTPSIPIEIADKPKRTDKPKVDADDVIEFILDTESFVFSNIFAAIVERFDRFKRQANETLKG